MKQIQIKNLVLVFLFLLPIFMMAQTITGTVKDENGVAIPYINIIEKGTTNKTTTGKDGAFSLRVSILPTTISANAIGFVEKNVEITNTNAVSIIIKEENLNFEKELGAGNAKSRTVLDSPSPIDFINSKDFTKSGKITLNELLTYKSASYNATNQTHADITTHYDIADLRGLGPSRMLVLVNGKRKNLSAITHINDTQGKGEVGTDMTSIPTSAIDYIEVLRDGASAIYGSDAIAGVINIVLKKNTDYTTAAINSGITSSGDGFEIGGDINGTFTNKKGGYINYTFNLQHQGFTDRAGEPGAESLFNTSGYAGASQWIKDNPDLGMTVGQPEIRTGNVYFNGTLPFKNGKGELYGSVGGGLRSGKSFTLYNAPYMMDDPYYVFHNNGEAYNGFQPKLTTDIVDNMDIFGVKFNAGKFKIDMSGTFGFNSVDIKVDDSYNPDVFVTPTNYDPLDPNSPQLTAPSEFESGAYHFSNIIGNVDVKRSFKKANIAIGAEYKQERFKVIAGEIESWFNNGTAYFNGISVKNKLTKDRNSFGLYANLDFDITKDFLIGAAARYDSYSDIGANTSYKVNARYKLGDKGAIRASYGTGFRAPALQQNFTNYTQNGTTLLINNAQRANLGIPDLEAETSTNINVGAIFKPMKNVSLSVDVYKITVDNRVMLSSDLGADSNTAQINNVEQLLASENVGSIRFFTNALDTETQGVDLTVAYNNIRFKKGVLGFNLGVNWNDTKIVGEVKTPNSLSAYNILNRTDKNRVDLSRPAVKGLLGINYEQEKFNVTLNNTLFGPVTWQHPTDYKKDQTFGGKVITDIVLGYKLYDWMKINLIVNNALNVYPDEIDTKGDQITSLGGRYKYAPQLNQFGFLGTQIRGGFTFQF